MKFEIGDKVITLTNPENELCQPREKGKIYIIHDIMYCAFCGVQKVNIGPKTDIYMTECSCGRVHDNRGLHFTLSKYFAKIDDDLLEKVIAEEDYELASIIRDNIKY